jgi:hypothetical protein
MAPSRHSAAEPTYEEWAAQGALLYSAFRCAALAEHAGKYDEFTRLFNAGIDIGRPLLEAAFAGRIQKRGDRWIVPLGLLGCLYGPNAEFVLGRMWECSRNDALRFITMEQTLEKQRSAAEQSFIQGNCAFIALPPPMAAPKGQR